MCTVFTPITSRNVCELPIDSIHRSPHVCKTGKKHSGSQNCGTRRNTKKRRVRARCTNYVPGHAAIPPVPSPCICRKPHIFGYGYCGEAYIIDTIIPAIPRMNRRRVCTRGRSLLDDRAHYYHCPKTHRSEWVPCHRDVYLSSRSRNLTPPILILLALASIFLSLRHPMSNVFAARNPAKPSLIKIGMTEQETAVHNRRPGTVHVCDIDKAGQICRDVEKALH